MSTSLLKLAVTAVAVAAVVMFGLLVTYASNQSWTEEDIRRVGIAWAYGALDDAPPDARSSLLARVERDLQYPLELVSTAEIRHRLGRELQPGERVIERRSIDIFVLTQAFSDGRGGLVVGPGDPLNPYGRFPIGLIIAMLSAPLVAIFVAFQISRQLRKVERASEALGAGVLSARVDNPKGPSSELAASFNAMAQRIERLVRERDELLQAVSHELGSPLARMRFHLELLDDDSDSPTSERVEALERQIDELDQLVEDLVRWVQSDEHALRRRSFDAVAPLADLVELARLDGSADGRVVVALDAPTNADLAADPRLYQRAIDNVLRNAVRYASQWVQLRLRTTPDSVIVDVADDGPGIPAEARNRVLEPFTRLEPDRDRRTGGVGLGLAIVHRILAGHGGEVSIGESERGGASVALRWPRGGAAAPVRAV